MTLLRQCVGIETRRTTHPLVVVHLTCAVLFKKTAKVVGYMCKERVGIRQETTTRALKVARLVKIMMELNMRTGFDSSNPESEPCFNPNEHLHARVFLQGTVMELVTKTVWNKANSPASVCSPCFKHVGQWTEGLFLFGSRQKIKSGLWAICARLVRPTDAR